MASSSPANSNDVSPSQTSAWRRYGVKSETELSLSRTTPSPSRQPRTHPPTTTSQQTMTMMPLSPTAKSKNRESHCQVRVLAAAKASQVEEETLSAASRNQCQGEGEGKRSVSFFNYGLLTNARPQPKTVSPTVLQSERRKAALKKHNPIATLVKETREEKRLLDLLDLDDEDDLDSLGSPTQKRSFLSGNEIDALRADLAAGDRRRLFGDQSEGIKNILDSDSRIIKADERRNIEVGVRFWTDDASSVDGDVDMNAEPTLDFWECSQFPVLRQLHHALSSEALSSPTNEDLSASAFRALRNVWLASRFSRSGITLRRV
ncbi:hypothetical protein F5878DRAFT_667716 [Lentinula raphanica]|uniref:Uncharacterized protein n=1 Tax=Lentinula raphanica TaxID=153919 RepID=A0AA38U2W7_9AGAR|nr:hypothetical protein F5878DRAFT_667716 [Lentinula raphanica]